MAKKDNERPILIKRIKKTGGGHHGGAWKVAYADFTTAMMAFFMLLWLLNVSDKKTLEGLADYFTPSSASVSGTSGAGKPLAGTVMDTSGAVGASASVLEIQGPPKTTQQTSETPGEGQTDADEAKSVSMDAPDRNTDKALAILQDNLRQAIQESPELARHRDQILVEETPEGIRIQLTDKEGRAMFQRGTAQFYTYAKRMMREIGAIVATLPNRVSIVGHTDADGRRDSGDYSSWELSADRANAARRILDRTGVSDDRIAEVVGKAATEPLYPTDPTRPENRRITILVLREAPVIAPSGANR
ncbi:MAG: flagellar motor protein MotB [Rhodothalassiaceae bacterium]